MNDLPCEGGEGRRDAGRKRIFEGNWNEIFLRTLLQFSIALYLAVACDDDIMNPQSCSLHLSTLPRPSLHITSRIDSILSYFTLYHIIPYTTLRYPTLPAPLFLLQSRPAGYALRFHYSLA